MPSIRVTQGMQYLQALSNLQRNSARLFENQDTLASGRRIHTPSDDPAGAARILDYGRRAADIALFRANIAAGQTRLDGSAEDLQSITDVFHHVRERVVQALNGTLSAEDRATVADELDHELISLLGYANTQVSGRYTFAGSRTDQTPFVRTTGIDGIERVVYRGDGLANHAEVAPGISETVNVPGTRLIDTGPRQATTFFGTTGARPGAGTDSGVGRARLTLAHTITGFGPIPGALVDPASGLTAGASSAANDTVLGYSHAVNLTVNAAGTGGTVSLDGGQVVNFTTAHSDLKVAGPNGELIYLNLSGVTAGFSGAVQVDAYGTFSLDGGQTSVPINPFTSSQQLFSPVDGSVLYVDPTGIKRTGTEQVTFGGTLDLFNSVLAIRDLLRTTGTPQEITAALDEARERLADLDRGQGAILRALGDAGATSERLTGLDQRMADLSVTIAARRSEIEDADLTTVLSDLQQNEAIYQSSLLVTARLSRLSLSNYL